MNVLGFDQGWNNVPENHDQDNGFYFHHDFLPGEFLHLIHITDNDKKQRFGDNRYKVQYAHGIRMEETLEGTHLAGREEGDGGKTT